MSRKRFKCMDCKVDTGKIGEHYMLKDTTWNAVHSTAIGMLCIGCLEQRLGRMLSKHDFNDSYVNNLNFGIKSQRLINRMQ